jgi:uncharacterized protein (DUF362 family)
MQIAKTIVEADFLINVPVMKTHVAVGISVCMKNLMGTISREQKRKFHFFGIAGSVVDLNSVVKPHLSIADGTVAGEGDGPMANEPVGFETLLVGTDNRIVDAVCARVMGFEPDEIEILKICNDRWGALPAADIEVVGETISQTARPFKHAAECVNPPEGIECTEGGACSSNPCESFAVPIQAFPAKAKMCWLSENACPTSTKPATLSPDARLKSS